GTAGSKRAPRRERRLRRLPQAPGQNSVRRRLALARARLSAFRINGAPRGGRWRSARWRRSGPRVPAERRGHPAGNRIGIDGGGSDRRRERPVHTRTARALRPEPAEAIRRRSARTYPVADRPGECVGCARPSTAASAVVRAARRAGSVVSASGRARHRGLTALRSWFRRPLTIESLHPDRPRQRERLRREAHLVVARLIVERSANRDAGDVAKRGFAVARRAERDVLDDPERLREHGNVLVERLEEIVFRLGILR